MVLNPQGCICTLHLVWKVGTYSPGDIILMGFLGRRLPVAKIQEECRGPDSNLQGIYVRIIICIRCYKFSNNNFDAVKNMIAASFLIHFNMN
jgi:hypothetical protein